ncbi:MAG: hypothetical protein KC502_10055 [Myxococcales bacterium]|nr:hypothetical protein [Myxococcales bacterium]
MKTSTRIGLAALVLGLVSTVGVTDATAGRRPFIWVWDTEVLHERDVEIEQWIWEMDKDAKRVAWLWWAPVIGVTDTLELAVPLEGLTSWTKTGKGAGATETRIARYGVELRWRLAENDPEESGPVVPLLRFAVKRDLGVKLAWLLEANAVVSHDVGKLHSALDLGAFRNIGASEATWLSYAAGSAWELREGLRAGAEVFGEIGISKGWQSFTMVGPNVSWTHGRSWLTIGCLIGVTDKAANWMPRLLWAVKL